MRVSSLSLSRRFAGRFRMRPAEDFEWRVESAPGEAQAEFYFFARRTPMQFALHSAPGSDLELVNVHAWSEADRDWVELEFLAERNRRRESQTLVAHLDTLVTTRRLRLELRPSGERDFEAVMWVRTGVSPDQVLVREGLHAAQEGELAAAVRAFESYEEQVARNNNFIHFYLSQWYRDLGRYDHAQDAAARGCASSALGVFRQSYVQAEELRPRIGYGEVERLRGRAREWSEGAAFGLLVLQTRKEIRLGVGGAAHIRKHCDLVEVLRPSAGRFMTQAGVRFRATTEEVLHSECRIRRRDGSVEPLGADQVSVMDDPSRNPFIAIERQRILYWILPDLAVGDIVEFSVHVLSRERLVGGRPCPAIFEPLCHPSLPTLEAEYVVTAPVDLAVRIVPSNYDGIVAREESAGRSLWAFKAVRHMPTRDTGYEYENETLDPHVRIVRDGDTWGDLARHTENELLGDLESDELPARLQQVLEEHADPEDALERCFYLLRDSLKYAATSKGKRRIGVVGRAAQILESGVGDCADKSYLLHLVCEALGLPHWFVVVDTQRGVVDEATPGDFFDHVFLRVELPDREVWLDAAEPLAAFDCAPGSCQGLTGLMLDGAGTLVRIPVDAPEQNRIRVTEVLDHFEGGRLAGEFAVEAHGISGRMLESAMKSGLLGAGDQGRGMKSGLDLLMPAILVSDGHIDRHSTHQRSFRAAGQHRRGGLNEMRSGRDELVQLWWATPQLMTHRWRALDHSRLAYLGLPVRLSVELVLRGEVRVAVRDCSTFRPFDDELGSAAGGVDETPEEFRVHREVVLRSDLVRAPLSHRLPGFADSVGSALTVALRIRARGAAEAGAVAG